jgi:hypothetical protein
MRFQTGDVGGRFQLAVMIGGCNIYPSAATDSDEISDFASCATKECGSPAKGPRDTHQGHPICCAVAGPPRYQPLGKDEQEAWSRTDGDEDVEERSGRNVVTDAMITITG